MIDQFAINIILLAVSSYSKHLLVTFVLRMVDAHHMSYVKVEKYLKLVQVM